MEADLQATATHVDALVVRSPHSADEFQVVVIDHPDLVASLEGFSTTAAELRPLLDEGNRIHLNEMAAIHDRYAESIYDLHSLENAGVDLMAAYHGTTEQLEAEIRDTLLEMRQHESEEIYASIVRSVDAEKLMLWLVPTLFALALSIAAYALRLQDKRRKHTITVLQQSNEEKDQFLATVSHELRTPLTSVLGFIEILADDGEPHSREARQEMLDLASREAWELRNLVEDLLVMARSDSGGLLTTDVRINLNAQAAQVLEGMDSQPQVSIESERPIAARGDPARTRQIIRNLLTNAFHYGGDRVQIRIDGDDHEARLQVIDNGPGVPESQRLEIFEAYHRADPSASPVGSVGLGLAVSRQLARAMNGDLTYRHESGHSIFELRLQPDPLPSAALESLLSSTPVPTA